jgi:hypothetical protein
LKTRRERRDRRSRPWAQLLQSLATSPSLAESESAATETPCTPSFDSEDTSSSTTSTPSSNLELPISTLLQQEIEEQLPLQLEDTFVAPRSSSSKLAETKCKDAHYDDAAPTVEPESLAGRQMLRPRIAYQQTSNATSEDSLGNPTVDVEVHASSKPAVAEELVQVARDTRKALITTQDYLEEGMKIMQMIRAKDKPKSSLTNVDEPVETSKLNSDAIPDPDIDEISSGDELSRPSKIPAPQHTQAAASRRYVAYVKATITSTYRTLVRALTPRKTASVPRPQAGSSRAAFCKIGMHKPMDKTPIDKLAKAMKAVLHIGNGRTPPPVLKSALKGGKPLDGHKVDKKLRFRCCTRVYTVESWKEDLRRETWAECDLSDYSEDEPDYHGIAWLDQSQDPE